MATRCDPPNDIEFVHKAWSSPLDPLLPPGQPTFNTRAIVDACRPWDRRDSFPPIAAASHDVIEAAMKKWGHLLES